MFNKEMIINVKNFVKENKIYFTDDGDFDVIKHYFSKELIIDSFIKGIILEDYELYPENPDLKHKGKNYYCIYKYAKNLIFSRAILISFLLDKDKITIFHTSPLNYNSREERFYRENIRKFKELFP